MNGIKKRLFWLISVCTHSNFHAELGEFHFRGYLYGQWVRSIIVKGKPPLDDFWQPGESYLLKLEISEISPEGTVQAIPIEAKYLNANEAWEMF